MPSHPILPKAVEECDIAVGIDFYFAFEGICAAVAANLGVETAEKVGDMVSTVAITIYGYRARIHAEEIRTIEVGIAGSGVESRCLVVGIGNEHIALRTCRESVGVDCRVNNRVVAGLGVRVSILVDTFTWEVISSPCIVAL